MTSDRPPRGRPRPKPKGFDDVPELSNEEVERRVDVRGGGTPRGPVERPVRAGRPPRPPQRTVARDSILLIGLVIVGLVAVRLLLPDGPLTGSPTQSPGGTLVVIGSVAPGTATPVAGTPGLQTLTPVVTPDSGSPGPTVVATTSPTVIPGPTPTLRPGETPKPTPKPTTAPTATAGPTPPTTTTLVVFVQVTTDSGGTATPASWTVSADSAGTASPSSFAGSASGTTVTISVGRTYQVTTSGEVGYSTGYSTNCSSALGGLPVAGITETCTITKNDRAPVVTVRTIVDGGTASPSDWTVTVTGTDVSPSGPFPGSAGREVRFDANAPFSVEQSNPSGGDYTQGTSGTCESASGLALGAVRTCTFTFTYVQPSEPPPAPSAPLAWLVIVAGVPGIRGRRRWTTFRTR